MITGSTVQTTYSQQLDGHHAEGPRSHGRKHVGPATMTTRMATTHERIFSVGVGNGGTKYPVIAIDV
jgi:hypothetical protein